MKKVTDDLLDAGREIVRRTVRQAAERRRREMQSCRRRRTSTDQTYTLPADLETQVEAAIEDWKMAGKVRRLWARDASLWTGTDEGSWFGWLGITEDQLAHQEVFEKLARRSSRRVSSTRCCWAWAAPACVPKY